MTASAPRIGCLDLDTFFVSVERLFDPSLIGKPVVVGAMPGNRGVVTACSYEVREFGVHSGMPVATAYKLAPHAIFLPTRSGVYGPYAKHVRALVDEVCPRVQVASIDELFCDFSGCERLYRHDDDASDDAAIERTVRELTATIARETGLPASVGIATSLPLSKIASGLAKPAGVLMVPAGSEAELLAPLSVRKYPGIGPVAERKLAGLGIQTLGQLARYPRPALKRIFGAWADSIWRGAHGQGSHQLSRDRPAFSEHDPVGGVVGSISNERTFREDVHDESVVDGLLCSLCERVCWRARKRGIKARTVTLKLRYADFHTISRGQTIPPTHSELELYPTVRKLYDKARTRSLAIRLLGLALSNLGHFDSQLSLFGQREARIGEAVDAIRERYGYELVRVAKGQRRKGKSNSTDNGRASASRRE
jgi:DNA polymerase-4